MSGLNQETKPDRRTAKTQAALRRAFFELIRSGGYEHVSIAEIVTRADVGRSTFYEHYRSKHDILRASMAHSFEEMAVSAVSANPSPGLCAVTAHLWENRRLAGEVFVGAPRLILARQHARLIEQKLTRWARERRARPLAPLALVAQHIAEAQIALLGAWLAGRSKCNAAEIADAMHASTYASAAALLRLT